jgi:hypothetical protein
VLDNPSAPSRRRRFIHNSTRLPDANERLAEVTEDDDGSRRAGGESHREIALEDARCNSRGRTDDVCAVVDGDDTGANVGAGRLWRRECDYHDQENARPEPSRLDGRSHFGWTRVIELTGDNTSHTLSSGFLAQREVLRSDIPRDLVDDFDVMSAGMVFRLLEFARCKTAGDVGFVVLAVAILSGICGVAFAALYGVDAISANTSANVGIVSLGAAATAVLSGFATRRRWRAAREGMFVGLATLGAWFLLLVYALGR